MNKIANIVVETGAKPADGTQALVIDGARIKNILGSVPVNMNFDSRSVVGKAFVRVEDGVLKANFELADSVRGLYYPCIGCIVHNQNDEAITLYTITEIGLCVSGNRNTEIKAIQL